MAEIYRTERLIIRDWEPERDAEFAFEMYTDDRVMRWLGGGGNKPANTEEMADRLAKRRDFYHQLGDGTGFWATERIDNGELVGATLLKELPGMAENEVGWHYHPRAWGNGFATEAARGALKYGFEVLGEREISAVLFAENVKSAAVAERLGMTLLGMCHAYNLDLLYYLLKREDFQG